MGYYIDLSRITLNEFKKKLKSTDLLPSQQIIKEDIDDKFQVLQSQNIENMHQLQQALKNKGNVNEFSNLTGLSVDYLTILRREVNSYHPRPRKIKDFTCLSSETRNKLENMGIKTTPQLYEKVSDKTGQDALKKELDIGDEEVLFLAKLCDVSRLRYVNPNFACLLINSDYDTVEKIKNAEFNELYQELIRANETNKYYKGRINLKDMKFLVNETINHSLDIKY